MIDAFDTRGEEICLGDHVIKCDVMWGLSHSGGYEEYSLLGYNAV
jgi:hypothetical protein